MSLSEGPVAMTISSMNVLCRSASMSINSPFPLVTTWTSFTGEREPMESHESIFNDVVSVRLMFAKGIEEEKAPLLKSY